MFVGLYREFANALPRHKWPQLPLIGDLIATREYYQVVRANRYSPVLDLAIFSHTSIAAFVKKWNREMKEDLLWKTWDYFSFNYEADESISDEDIDGRVEQLSMAFECPRCDTALFGWNDVSTHWCHYFGESTSNVVLPSSESEIQLNLTRYAQHIIYLGSGVKRFLLKVPKWACIAGREGVTVQDMDADATECVFRYFKKDGESQLLVLNWRQYVREFLSAVLGFSLIVCTGFPCSTKGHQTS